ncbi:MAG: DnaJ domain-containing protein, partial [Pyrinomonadaceae bacterium]
GLSGAVRLDQQRVKAVVYFEAGNVIFAASNIRNLRLREYVTKRGLLSEAQLCALGNNRSDSALAATLSTNGLIDRNTINELFAAMVSDLLRASLLWSEGVWEFDDRSRLVDSFRVKIETPSLLIEASRKMPPNFVSSRFLDPEEIISPGTGTSLGSAGLLPLEGFVLSRVEQPMPLSEVVLLSGMREPDAQRTIYGLALAGYLQRARWPRMLQEGAFKQKKVVPPPPAPVPPPPVEKIEEQDLEGFFERMKDATNYYEVLNVTESADLDEIKRAYYMLARSYHPDRFHAQAQVHKRVESAFARITQSYEILSHAKHRSTYDSKLAAQRKAKRLGDAAPKASRVGPGQAGKKGGPAGSSGDPLSLAENSFKEGYAALQLGQTSLAITHLAAAAQAAPHEPRYRAYYGQALAAQGRSQRLAETELQAAVKLEPGNPDYRLMLAQLYYDLTFYRRARTEAERAVELDPNNSTAQALLRKLESK